MFAFSKVSSKPPNYLNKNRGRDCSSRQQIAREGLVHQCFVALLGTKQSESIHTSVILRSNKKGIMRHKTQALRGTSHSQKEEVPAA